MVAGQTVGNWRAVDGESYDVNVRLAPEQRERRREKDRERMRSENMTPEQIERRRKRLRVENMTLQRRLSSTLRARLRSALAGNFKGGSAVRDLGCTIPELKS